MPTTEGTAEMTLDAANKATITMVEDHLKNSHRHEMKLHAPSAKAERLLWHQRLAHCGDEQLCRAHMFSDGVPKIARGKDLALDSCPACLAANMKSRNRGDGETRTATEPGQGLSLDFLFAGQHSKNAMNPEQMLINNCMGVHGETCCLLLCDHATEQPDGVCRQSKVPPIAWLKKWLTKNVNDDVKDRHVFVNQGGELCRSKAIRDLFKKEFGYEMQVTGTGVHHQNGLLECANQMMDKAIRAMLICWRWSTSEILASCVQALSAHQEFSFAPRRDSTESAHQKLHGEKDNLGLLRTFGCRLWVKILAWQNQVKCIQDTKKGIFLGYRTNTLKNVAWHDPLTDRVKHGYHVRFDEGFNDLPLAQLQPNVALMDWREEQVPAETLTITIPPFTTSEHPFFNEDDVTVKVACESDMYGFELSEDDCMKRVYISGLKKDGRGTNGRRSCNTMCSSKRATRRKCRGAHITAIDDEEIAALDQAKEKFAELCGKKMDSFTMILAREPKLSKSMMQRAYAKLELSDFASTQILGKTTFPREMTSKETRR